MCMQTFVVTSMYRKKGQVNREIDGNGIPCERLKMPVEEEMK